MIFQGDLHANKSEGQAHGVLFLLNSAFDRTSALSLSEKQSRLNFP